MSDQDPQDPVEEPQAPDTTDMPDEQQPDTGKRDESAAIAALRRENARLKKDAEKRARTEAEQQGKWQEIAEKEQREREALEAKLAERERREVATKVASRLRFRDPDDAMRFLTSDELETETAADRALKRLAKDKPYLIEPARERTGAQVGSPTQPADDPRLAQGQRILDALTGGR